MNDTALELLRDTQLAEISERYIKEANKRRRECLKFNAFSLVSDLYYRENFHSDVLKAFLDMHGQHGAKELYLQKFIEFLLVARPDNIAPLLKPKDFKKYSTTREEGHVDVLILDNESRKAIIIENKINGAVDQKRQLPGYFEYVEKKRSCQVVAIVYLSMSGDKYPEYNGWKKKDREAVEAVLIPVGAYTNNDKPDLVDHWLKQCIKETMGSDEDHEDARALLRQYQRLLRFQGASTMNSVEMKKFYDMVVEGDRYEQVKALTEMFAHIPYYFLQRQVVDYNVQNKCEPFGRVKTDIPYAQLAFKDLRCNGKFDGISLLGSFVDEGKFVWSFLDGENMATRSARVESLLKASHLIEDYSNDWPWPARFQSRPFEPPTNPPRINEIRAFLDNTLAKLRSVTLADIK